jgi:hypothetical protein
MPTCRDVSHLIGADTGRLRLFTRLLISLHVRMCGRCARLARELRRIGDAPPSPHGSPAEDAQAIARLERLAVANIGGATDGRDDGYLESS